MLLTNILTVRNSDYLTGAAGRLPVVLAVRQSLQVGKKRSLYGREAREKNEGVVKISDLAKVKTSTV